MSQYPYQGPEQYRPISAWGYVGYSLLFSIPLVGFILLIVYAASNTNINLRNYARSYFCYLLLAVILCVVGFVVMLLLGVSVSELTNQLR